MKQVISHITKTLVLDGSLRQDALKIGTGSGSNVGIYFDIGTDNLPGIRFVNIAGGSVLNLSNFSADQLFTMENPSATGYDRIWSYTNTYNETTSVKRSPSSEQWIITSSIDGTMAYATSDAADPWDCKMWYVRQAGTEISDLVTLHSQTEGSKRWEYSLDGTTWNPIGESGESFTYKPITFTASNLVDGKLTINHNLGTYVLGLGYTVPPKNEIYNENSLVLDYSDQPSNFEGGVVWFKGSDPSMISGN